MFSKIRFQILKRFAPVMVGRYRKPGGKILPLTRISNTTYVGDADKLDIADNVFIGHFNFIEASHGITIGTGTQITNYISVITHSSHIAIRLYGKEYTNVPQKIGYVTGPVKIGAYTFVGPHSVIMPDTVIGKGCLISAFSYVRGEFPDFSIITGNPAKVVGDTRDLDRPYLEAHPELRGWYEEWAGNNKKQ